MSDRGLTIAFGISLAAHLLLVFGQFLSLDWFRAPDRRGPLEVIYEHEALQQELRELQEQLARAKRETVSAGPSADVAERPRIRIPDKPSLIAAQNLLDVMPGHGAVVDLTNLVDAARGDPVLLTYFSAIREQIQHTANREIWLDGAGQEGLVYVSFVLTSSGVVREASIVGDRSAAAGPLRETALRIVKAAAPFPAFPPSILEPRKTIVVPLEFLLGG